MFCSLRARFESMRETSGQQVRTARVKVNRFVVSVELLHAEIILFNLNFCVATFLCFVLICEVV